MIDMDIFDVKKIELVDLHKQGEDTWIRYFKIQRTNGETFTLTMFAETKEALQVEVSETKKI